MLNNSIVDKNEKPLQNMVTNGGYASIFRSFAVIGDSLSSGEFEVLDEQGNKYFLDLFEHSWGQYMARDMGSTCYNFSRGGMTAKEYMDSFALKNDFFNIKYSAQAYIIALGVNDLNNIDRFYDGNFGTYDDIGDKNSKSFIGYYSAIIARYKEIQPDAKFFLMTFPKGERPQWAEKFRDLLYKLAEVYDNIYVLDLCENSPQYDVQFRKYNYLNGHLNPIGYRFTALMVESYIDYIIRHNIDEFKYVGLIGHSVDFHPDMKRNLELNK